MKFYNKDTKFINIYIEDQYNIIPSDILNLFNFLLKGNGISNKSSFTSNIYTVYDEYIKFSLPSTLDPGEYELELDMSISNSNLKLGINKIKIEDEII